MVTDSNFSSAAAALSSLSVSPFHVFHPRIEFSARMKHSSNDDAGNAARALDAFQRIAIQQEQVGQRSELSRACQSAASSSK
ncbi:MAG TPA: hypothetical protein VFR96_04725 [Povalibacter sp.]|nr:hypothetical protein [Povalibacter sp.]